MEFTTKNALLWGLDKYDITILKHLSSHEGTIVHIAQATGIPRTSLYYMLPKLEQRGFVTSWKKEKKTFWKLANIDDIQKKYHDSMNIAMVPTETIMPVSDTTSLEIYRGKKNVLHAWKQIANLPPKSRVLGIQPEQSLLMAVTKNNIQDVVTFNETVKRKQIIVEGIIHKRGTDSMYKVLSKKDGLLLLKSFAGRTADTSELPDQLLTNTTAEMYLYGDKIAIVNWKEELCVIIRNKDVNELMKTMFASTKYLLKKYDQNEKIAQRLVDFGMR
ncbi:MAG: winged helix-turn-helix transcriptional regulator [Candidatus Taylorbacteria bacterium]|nr:winged helix-turn-helix transcriptional regulator [Candidatus Taylorbacteria bacterium]